MIKPTPISNLTIKTVMTIKKIKSKSLENIPSPCESAFLAAVLLADGFTMMFPFDTLLSITVCIFSVGTLPFSAFVPQLVQKFKYIFKSGYVHMRILLIID